jgi:Zn-dependent peptidase ImmA (M78 family)
VKGMDPVLARVEQFRREHFAGQLSALPVDVFTVAELDLRLDIIPFDDLFAKYGLDAMLLQDFTGIYIDAETYQYLEHGPVWKQKRLRFTFAHELGHYVLHRAEAKQQHFPDFAAFFCWMQADTPTRRRIEYEANRFAGRLLVPLDRLTADFADFRVKAAAFDPNWQTRQDFRRAFAERLSDRYGVNAQVIETSLDQENIWPSQ